MNEPTKDPTRQAEIEFQRSIDSINNLIVVPCQGKDARVEIRCGNMRIATSSSSVPETEEELILLLKEVVSILEAPEVEDKEFF